METPHRHTHDTAAASIVVIQPLAIRNGPYFGKLTLSVFARYLRMGELPRSLSRDNQAWQLTAAIDERNSPTRIDPVRQLGNLIVVSGPEGVRTTCDEWAAGLTTPSPSVGGGVINCEILNTTEEHPLYKHPYPDFIRRYDLFRTVSYDG